MSAKLSYAATNVPSHHPKKYFDDDLGYADYANAFFNQIETLNGSNSGIAFGIFGDWGIGKSSLLKMLRQKLMETDRYLIVEFNAWRYLQQEELWLAFLRKIIAAIEEENLGDVFSINLALIRNRFENSPNFAAKTIRLVLAIPAIIFLTALLIIVLYNSIIGYSQIIAWLTAGGTGVAVFFTLLTRFGEAINGARKKIRADLPDLVGPGFDREQPISIDSFLSDFQTIVRKIGEKKTIVTLIDDLDRCPPDQIVPVLEAIKHLGLDDMDANTNADRALILFVLAIDRDAIEQAVRGYFKDYFQDIDKGRKKDVEIAQFSREYVEKIIQIHFELPPLSPQQLLQLIRKPFEKFREENPSIDKSSADNILAILSFNPESQPRAVLQAYSAFLNRWEIVKQRELQNEIFPEALALLLVIQYVWPNVFERIHAYPQHFFYLHALTTGIRNNFCSDIEIDEIHELGLAANEYDTQLSIIHDNAFSLLMKELDISKWSKPLGTLRTHLLLSREGPTHQVRSELIWEVLQSGDPVRIKYVLQENSVEVARIFRNHTLSFLSGLSDQAKTRQTESVASQLDTVEKAIVASGIINDLQVVPMLIDLLKDGSLPLKFQLRGVYALGHYASGKNMSAISALTEIIRMKEGSVQAVRSKAIHMLRYCHVDDNVIDMLLEEIKHSDKNKHVSSLLRTVIKESIINADWWTRVLERIDPQEFAPADVLEFCLGPQREATAGKWPERLAEYLINLSITEPVYRDLSYGLLETHNNEDAVIDWLATLSIKLVSSSEAFEPWLRRCWSSMAEIQKKMLEKTPGDAWKKSTWKKIQDLFMTNKFPEEMVGFVEIISDIMSIEAIEFLHDMYFLAPNVGSWKRNIRIQLELIGTRKQNSKVLLQKVHQVISEITRNMVENTQFPT